MSLKFKLGIIVMTRGVANWSDPSVDKDAAYHKVHECLARHASGDWGDMDDEDKALNDHGLSEEHPGRLFSAYDVDGVKIWIITEWDRSATTILFPDEY